MRSIERRLNQALEWSLAGALLLIAILVVLQVFLSQLWNTSITGANELVTKIFVYCSTMGAALAVGRNEHIQISAAIDLLPPRGQRAIYRLTVLAVAGLNGVLLWFSIRWIRVTGDYLMPTTQLPRWVVEISIPLGSGIALLYCLCRLIDGSPPRDQLDSEEHRG